MARSMNAQIIFNPKWPKDWKERLAAQRDSGFQERLVAWEQEQDPKLKEQKCQAVWVYWDKRKAELGFTEEEE